MYIPSPKWSPWLAYGSNSPCLTYIRTSPHWIINLTRRRVMEGLPETGLGALHWLEVSLVVGFARPSLKGIGR